MSLCLSEHCYHQPSPPSTFPLPALLQRATFALSRCLPSGYFRGGHIEHPPNTDTHTHTHTHPPASTTYCSPSTVIALLSFITASVNVTAQSVDCPFMSAAPKQRFVSVCPHYHFICMRTCGQFPPPTASKGILKVKHSRCAEGNGVAASARHNSD